MDPLYRAENGHPVNHLIQSLKAESLYKRDVDYAVIDGEVKIIDEFTGRILEGRRWSEGLHQAVEAKEGVRVQEENQTLATITLQNYFRMYDKLAGMTGTAITEATEFLKIYKLSVVQIPTNRPMVRDDRNDQVDKTKDGKWSAVAREMAARRERRQPVLVGTISVEVSELLSHELTKRGIKHTVLNAKPEHAEREGEIVAEAGQPGAVTIATNMAGRGVDIKLGGNPEHLSFFQAEDGIRDVAVTGVQTCALPISQVLAEAVQLYQQQPERVVRVRAAGPQREVPFSKRRQHVRDRLERPDHALAHHADERQPLGDQQDRHGPWSARREVAAPQQHQRDEDGGEPGEQREREYAALVARLALAAPLRAHAARAGDTARCGRAPAPSPRHSRSR